MTREYSMTSRARILSIGILILCSANAVSVRAQSPRGITPEDYFSFEFASDPKFSPDGKLVAYVVTKVDRAQNRRNSSIWMVATDGSRPPCQFTTSPQSSTSPRWSPNGKWLAFLSSRPGSDSTSSLPVPAASPNPTPGPAPPTRHRGTFLTPSH